MKLEGNTILITGGARGIGFALAEKLIESGNTVITTGRDQGRLDAAKKLQPKLHVIQSDVSRAADIVALHARVTQEFPELNVVINNAGVMRAINLHDDCDLETLTSEIDTNLMGTVRMARQFLGHLKSKPSAAIVNISSGLAFVPLPISPVYCATKAAVHSFTLSLRAQLKHTHVQVFELLPPATQTDLLGNFDEADFKGVTIMKLDEMIRQCLHGLEKDQLEVRPGQSNQLKLMNRVAPEFILGQLSKPVDRMLEGSK